jgi:selenocysteine lyase/cysteine desulfurase
VSLACQRHLFEIPDDIAYLDCAYMSPLLRAVREAGEAAVARKVQPWRIGPEDFFSECEAARGLLAALIGATADGIAIIPSASYGLAVAAANLPAGPDQRIVMLEGQHPSNVYVWRDLARRTGATVWTVARPADHDWTTALLRDIDERTAIVAVPNCHWTDGSLVDLVRLGRRVRAVGAALVVDATQSIGAHPLGVADVEPDFLVTATYKWLLGPYSLAFLYVGPQHRDGQPIEFNRMARLGSQDIGRAVDYVDAFQPGARRFDVGERSNFILLPMAIAALRQLQAWGVADISSTLGELTDLIEREAGTHGLQAIPAARRARHMIGLRASGALPHDLAARLAATQVFVSLRGQTIRVSPHVYNTEEDVYRLFEALTANL